MSVIDRRFLFLLAGAVFLVAGCDAAPTEVYEERSASFTLEVEEHVGEHGPVVASVRGGGHYFVGEDEEGDRQLRHTSVVALKYADGTVRGQFEIRDPSKERRVHGRVTCVSVSGNEARIAGRVTESTEEESVGRDAGFKVRDNGTSREDPEDEVSEVVEPAPAQLVCQGVADGALEPTMRPIDAGNLVVEERVGRDG